MIPCCLLCLVAGVVAAAGTQGLPLPPGVVAGSDYRNVPIPASRYQIYLIGEFHGAQETKSFLLGFLTRLHREAGLRDIALEEDQAYQQTARDYVDGKTGRLPSALCLRTDVFDLIREFNASVPADQRVRVHLVDIDSPMHSIRQHLLDLKERLGLRAISIPDEQTLRQSGLELIDQMLRFAADDGSKAELETVRSSILANREGVEVGTSWSDTKGNVLIEAREGTIARNILNVLKSSTQGVVLGFYGVTHVTKKRQMVTLDTTLPFGNVPPFDYDPLASRLIQAGVTVASISCWALSGTVSWRGRTRTIPPQGAYYRVSEQESVEQLMAKAPNAKFLWVELAKCPGFLVSPNETLSDMYDYMVLIKSATAMKDACTPPSSNSTH